MQGLELSAYIDKAERGDPAATVAQLLRDLSAGKVKHEDVHSYYTEKFKPVLVAKVRSFQEGKLFLAQTESFDDFSAAKNYPADWQTYLDLRADLDMVADSAFKKLMMAPILRFIEFRITVPGSATNRKKMEERYGLDRIKDRWLSGNKFNHWEWRA